MCRLKRIVNITSLLFVQTVENRKYNKFTSADCSKYNKFTICARDVNDSVK